MKLVLLPGMDGTGDLFAPFIEALGDDIKVDVVRYPYEGGQSYAEFIARVLPSLPAEPYVLLAESFSGPIALAVAATAPQNLCGLILCCTFARNPRPVFGNLSGLAKYIPLSLLSPTLLSHGLLGRFTSKELRRIFSRAIAKVPPEVLRERLSAVLSVDVTPLMRKVSVPVMYMAATSDMLVPTSAGRYIGRLISRVRHVEIEGPHFLLQTAPARAAIEVRRFFSLLAQ